MDSSYSSSSSSSSYFREKKKYLCHLMRERVLVKQDFDNLSFSYFDKKNFF